MQRPTVVILAAGKGKRMFSSLPKVLHPIAGKPLLAHVLATAQRLEPAQVIVVVGHGGEQVRQSLAAPGIAWVEQAEQLGTGHALKMALPQLPADGITLVLYGDVPLTRSETLQALLQAAGDGMAVLTDVLDDARGYGRIVRDAQGRVSAIVEDKDCNDEQRQIREINTGILALPNRHLAQWLNALSNSNAQGEYYLTDVVALACQAGVPVGSVTVQQGYEAAGVNNKSQLAALERIYQQTQAEALMQAGVTLLDPARIDVRGSLQCGQDVSIDVNCVFIGEVVLGDNVQIGANCVLKNVHIAAGSQIASFSLLEDSRVGSDCKVGPYARLRPDSVLADQVHIGNFVEIKKSTVGHGSKVNHLTYIGDASIGSQVNVGAGCVTVNYNGVDKFRTVVEDDVFVGSGVLMIAPVTLETGSTIGAGSVISKTAPAGELTLARARQVTIPGWQRPKKKS